MNSLPAVADGGSLCELTRAPDFCARACAAIAAVATSGNQLDAMLKLRTAASTLGASSAWFVSYELDDATLCTYRVLLACDPVWGLLASGEAAWQRDPWLQYALGSSEPIRASELAVTASDQRAMADKVASHGFRSAVIVPAPSGVGRARVGALCLGSATAGFYDDAGFDCIRVLARGLAMDLHDWWHQRIRDELMERARVNERDIALLRHAAAGHSSKMIAAALRIEAKTVDCRFQRLSAKLGAANRNGALRVAQLYGLL